MKKRNTFSHDYRGPKTDERFTHVHWTIDNIINVDKCNSW